MKSSMTQASHLVMIMNQVRFHMAEKNNYNI